MKIAAHQILTRTGLALVFLASLATTLQAASNPPL